MSISSINDTQLIKSLDLFSDQLNRYFSLFIFLFGITGNILNIIVLSQRAFRSNPCIYFFLISSISNLICILVGLTPRILSGWHMDYTENNTWACKLRAFLMFTTRTIGLWLILLATIDRWILTLNHAQYRSFSSIKNAQRGSWMVIIVSILLYTHVIYCYESNTQYAPLRCYGKASNCRLLTDIIYVSCTITLPLMLMVTFGSITISNITNRRSSLALSQIIVAKYSKGVTSITKCKVQQRRKKIDQYLRRMLLLQVLLLICLTLPQSIHKLCSTLMLYPHKPQLHHAINRFIYNFDLLLSYIASGMPFYIYTLTGGELFRNALKHLIVRNK